MYIFATHLHKFGIIAETKYICMTHTKSHESRHQYLVIVCIFRPPTILVSVRSVLNVVYIRVYSQFL